MTAIKQTSVCSERHLARLRDYLSWDRDKALAHGTQNIIDDDRWFQEMADTRAAMGHDRPGKAGAKCTYMQHQILGFLPDECDLNGGKMTPELCMRYAREYVAERYPNQEVVMVLHRERCRADATDRYAVHLICDEIAVGCGRSGSFFAHEQAGIRPDFLCLSKGISGGYLPLSIVLTTDSVYQAFYDDATTRAFLHSHSYTGNALACRAALATLDIFAADQVLENNRLRAQKLLAALSPIADHPQVRHLRQRGMILAFDVTTEDPRFNRRFYRAALDNEALLRPIGNTVYLMPPYIIDDGEIAHLGRAVENALTTALRP